MSGEIRSTEIPGPTPADDAERLDEIGAELSGVDVALRRLDEGSYGTCEVCGIPIPSADLGADPLAARCTDHAR